MTTDTILAHATGRTWCPAARRDLNDPERFQQFELDEPLPTSRCSRFAGTVHISPREAAKRHYNVLGDKVIESIYVPARTKIEFRFDAPMHLLVMYEDGARRDGETLIDGLASSKLRNFNNKLSFVPAGHTYHEWHETSVPLRVTYLHVDPTKFQKSSEADGLCVPRAFFEDSVVWETAAKLKGVIESGRSGSMCYSDALVSVLAHELARSNPGVIRIPPSRGGLAGWQIRSVTTYVEEHLDEQISLKTLAEAVHLSQYHFCRAFKQSFGMPPHEYHVHRRIEEAKVLLADRAASVLDVALRLGYSHASSFTIAFRRVTGRTPSEFRRDFG